MFLKRLFFSFLILTIYFLFVWFFLVNLADPKLTHFQNYHRLVNWDSTAHGDDDFDNDGKKDLITASGCAFLSSVKIDSIPGTQRCKADKLVGSFFKDGTERTGQKYIPTDLDFSYIDSRLPVSHSYLARNKGENWKIYIVYDGNSKIYEIENNGKLVDKGTFSLISRLDEFLYFISSFFVLFNIPLIPLFFTLAPILEKFGFINDSNILFCYLIVLALITVILYLISKSRKINNQD